MTSTAPIRLFSICISLFTILFISACRNATTDSEVNDTSTELAEYYEASGLPAAIMGYVDREGNMHWEAFGPSIWGGTDTVSPDHIFRMFSMTKAIASVAALQLVEQGKIGLDDPLNDMMPEMVVIPILNEDGELQNSQSEITLRHLLTHTAGFGYDFTSARLANFQPESWDYADKPRLFEPGERWLYGTNTDWVGRVVEKVSGMDLETYLRANITGPLGMERTWFNVPDALQKDIVSWGNRDSTSFNPLPRLPQNKATEFSAGGGLFGSPRDYLTFLKCLLNDGKYANGQLLKPETTALLFKNQLVSGMTLNYDLPPEGVPDNLGEFPDESDVYSLGFALENNPMESVRSKGSGYWAGIANSYYTVDKSKGIAIVYFTQFLPFNDKDSHGFYRLYEKYALSSNEQVN